ncbi:hypothetical protein BDR26DRAFT_312015 [Obelidium mucronatum]|nr:hypothetical protein BDR26DRAFT_312015 [Obelidium mucronatum]
MKSGKDTKKAITKEATSKEKDPKYHGKLPVLPAKPRRSIDDNTAVDTAPSKNSLGKKEKLEPIPSTAAMKKKAIEAKSAGKSAGADDDGEVIELGPGTAIIPPSRKENDTVVILSTIISLNLGDASSLPKCKKEPKPPSITFDVSERKLWKIPLKHLQMLIDTIHKQAKYTPLLIDPSGRVDTYFTYAGNGHVVDTKKYLVQCDIQKIITKEDVKEDIRRQIVAGLKHGKTMVFAMLNSAFGFKKYFDPSFFPEQILEHSGVKFLEEDIYKPCLRKEDYDEFGRFWPNEEFPFRSVVTTLFELEDYEDFLTSNLNLEHFMPIYIEKDSQ